jgi:hypothetical protein
MQKEKKKEKKYQSVKSESKLGNIEGEDAPAGFWPGR